MQWYSSKPVNKLFCIKLFEFPIPSSPVPGKARPNTGQYILKIVQNELNSLNSFKKKNKNKNERLKLFPKFLLQCLTALHSYFLSQLPGMTHKLTHHIAENKKLRPCAIELNEGNTSAKQFPCGLARWCVFPDNIVQGNTLICVAQHSNRKTGVL